MVPNCQLYIHAIHTLKTNLESGSYNDRKKRAFKDPGCEDYPAVRTIFGQSHLLVDRRNHGPSDRAVLILAYADRV